jgi:hypothetical protein
LLLLLKINFKNRHHYSNLGKFKPSHFVPSDAPSLIVNFQTPHTVAVQKIPHIQGENVEKQEIGKESLSGCQMLLYQSNRHTPLGF